ncbi:unnamed protein product [Brachionus calyciflorus]|uniref:Uncharacterized protein n=1 Tax=Brachionus calyciflorus TaxID=104777 RepID=A0A814BDD2_9BILA|nr:unnamed protein product [Brachionus calyciflorus]
MSLLDRETSSTHILNELLDIRKNPEQYVRDVYLDITAKINLHREMFINQMITKINEYYLHIYEQLENGRALSLDKIKFGMENCFSTLLCHQHSLSDSTLLEINKIIRDIVESEIKLLNCNFRIDMGFLRAQFVFRSNELLKIQLLNLPKIDKIKPIGTLKGHCDQIYQLSKTPFEDYIITASRDNSVKLWDLKTKKCKWSIKVIKPIFQVFEDEVICAEEQGGFKFYDLFTGQFKSCIVTMNLGISCILVLNENIILTGLKYGEIMVWSRKKTKILDVIPGHLMSVTSLKMLNKNELLSCSCDMNIKLWNLKDKVLVRSFEGHKNWVTCIEIFNENEFLSGCKDGSIKIWHRSIESCVNTLHAHTKIVNSIQVFENYQIFSCSDDGTIKHWDTVNSVCLRSVQISSDFGIFDFALLSNDSVLVTENNQVKIWK